MAQNTIKIPAPAKGTTYRYVALNRDNKLVKGTVKATNEAIAGHMLTENGLKPVSFDELASRFTLEQMLPSLFGVKPQEVPAFSRQLATLLESGITIMAALELIQHQVGSRAFRKVLLAVIDDLRSGVSFSAALARHPAVFDDIYCKTMAMAEQTGRLEVILKQMADYQERQKEARKKVSGALTYPAIMIGLGIVVAIILLTTALPPMIDMFEQMSVDLPLPTRILMGVSDIVHGYGKHLAVAFLVLAVPLAVALKRPEGRLRFDRLLLKAPVIGPPMHSSEVARFSRTTSVLLNAGLALQEIMEMIPMSISNRAMRRSLTKVGEDLVRGEGLSDPMARDELFPPLLIQMVMVGEESNTLDSSLAVAADFYEADSSDKISAMVKVIQPLSTVFVALLVGFMALAVIMPMYSITGAFE
jgi:type IV pilus assembly protein PilC